MKRILVAAVLGVFAVSAYGGGQGEGKKVSCEERRKAEHHKHAEHMRKKAAQYKKYKVSSHEKKAGGEVKEAAEKVVACKRALGCVYEEMADAYASGDEGVVKEAKARERTARGDLDIAEREKRVAGVKGQIKHYLKKYPDSAELKSLKTETDEACEKYLGTSQQIRELEKSRTELEEAFRTVSKKLGEVMHAEKKKAHGAAKKHKK